MQNNWNINIFEYQFYEPIWLLFLLIVPIYLWYKFKKTNKTNGTIRFSGSDETQRSLKNLYISYLKNLIIFLNAIVLSLMIIAMSKPFHWSDIENIDENHKNGIDIILAMDVSMSMLAMDFKPNRLEVSKKVAQDFVNNRKGDRIGLVVFAGEAYTACPATLDYNILNEQISLANGEKIEAGTAIGTGLGTAVTRLRNDSIPSKVIILLTDGSNNAGEIDPLVAAELAKAKNIRVYTIGVGTNGFAPTPVITPFGVQYENVEVEIDEMALTKIAKTTGGKYFRATNENSLSEIYKEIDRLEKKKFVHQKFQSEPPSNPRAFINWAMLFIIISFSIDKLFFKWND